MEIVYFSLQFSFIFQTNWFNWIIASILLLLWSDAAESSSSSSSGTNNNISYLSHSTSASASYILASQVNIIFRYYVIRNRFVQNMKKYIRRISEQWRLSTIARVLWVCHKFFSGTISGCGVVENVDTGRCRYNIFHKYFVHLCAVWVFFSYTRNKIWRIRNYVYNRLCVYMNMFLW